MGEWLSRVGREGGAVPLLGRVGCPWVRREGSWFVEGVARCVQMQGDPDEPFHPENEIAALLAGLFASPHPPI